MQYPPDLPHIRRRVLSLYMRDTTLTGELPALLKDVIEHRRDLNELFLFLRRGELAADIATQEWLTILEKKGDEQEVGTS